MRARAPRSVRRRWRAQPDGYTLLLAPTAVVAITPHMRKVPYDAEHDFAPVACVSSAYGLVAARRDLPASNIAELVALAKREPGKLTFGSVGVGTATHITGEIVHRQTGIQVLHVPYKGSAESLNDLLGGRIDLIYDPVALAQAKAGHVKVLATIGEARHPELPDVPTLAEQGVQMGGGSWFGVFAPRGTPPEIVQRLSAEIARAMRGDAVREQLQKFSQYPDYLDAGAFATRIAADSAFYRALVESAGLRGE